MNTRRLIWALLAALAVSGACTMLLGRKITARGADHPPRLRYVAASRPIAAGEALKADELVYIDWPANDSVEGAFTKREAIVGRSTLYPIEKG